MSNSFESIHIDSSYHSQYYRIYDYFCAEGKINFLQQVLNGAIIGVLDANWNGSFYFRAYKKNLDIFLGRDRIANSFIKNDIYETLQVIGTNIGIFNIFYVLLIFVGEYENEEELFKKICEYQEIYRQSLKKSNNWD